MDAQTIPVLLTDPQEVIAAERLLALSRIGCPGCINNDPPQHSKMYLFEMTDGFIGMSNSGCQSNSPRYDPHTKTLVGHAHCTCDSCF